MSMMEWINTVSISFVGAAVIKLLMASVCGALVGIEREIKGRPAGMKTFSLVCVGATLAMITNEYIYTYMSNSTGDMSRMAAQVISGIGFLGAGTIIVTGNSRIKGLTTAAALWVTASIGIAIGTGFYAGAIIGVIVVVLSARIYQYVDDRILNRVNLMELFVEGTDEKVLLTVLNYFEDENVKVTSLQRTKDHKWVKDDTAAIIEIIIPKGKTHDDVLEELKKLPDMRTVFEHL
ncbi:MgtC/SapB family protein [Hespellia stercorisuis]|uniref:Putative Mg2+ transporter-C (MgtC) family protein n=1 Tax=Hespellia stercorisuis DSM 15480 TaxID=1121950 RepID=A0A1M6K9Z7_9FIRM|nr:MgtC/SapB family protein [Hespellia stercorisuis]SHJ55805.1 putative Mg2+ transporter-C (MgtC) family protein [Hespellia stercorisuis DSM 15480]